MKRRLIGDLYTHHVGLAIAALILAFIGGILLGSGLAGRGYEPSVAALMQYKLNEPHPLNLSVREPISIEPRPAAASAHINFALMLPTQNQGSVGQCDCYAVIKYQFGYLIARRVGHRVDISCRLVYSAIARGVDRGSVPGQYKSELMDFGWVPSSVFDYSGIPQDSELEWPLPAALLDEAAKHRYAIHFHWIAPDPGGGPGVINAIESEIAAGRPVHVGMPVWQGGQGQHSLFDVTPVSPIVDVPGDSTLQPIGYHAVTIEAYDRTRQLLLAQNQWGKDFGVTRTGQQQAGHAGYFYLSYRFAEQYLFSILSLRLTATTPQQRLRASPPLAFYQPGPSVDRPLPAPPLPRHGPPVFSAGAHVYVKSIMAKDAPVDIGKLVDQEAAARHLDPITLLATVGAECGLQTHSTECDREVTCADTSFGPMQVTVGTAAQEGVGNGYCDGYYGSNTSYVRNYENVARQGIDLGARVLESYANYLRTRTFDPCPEAANGPHLYVAWNAGPGNPCWFLMNPTGQAGTNYYGNFVNWVQWAESEATTTNPVTPPTFPRKVYCRYRAAHHWACNPPRYARHLNWPQAQFYRHRRLGPFIGATWHPGHPGFDMYAYVKGYADCWPASGRCMVHLR